MATETKTTKPNLFAKAKGKVADTPTSTPTKETIWRLSPIPDAADKAVLNNAVNQLHDISAKRKQLETEEGIHKATLVNFANDKYINHVSAMGVEPKSPLKIINDDNRSVTFVVQDRGHLTKVTDEILDGVAEVIGQKEAESIVVTLGTFQFDPAVMAQNSGVDGKSVSELLAEELSPFIEKLREKGKLTEEQADNLIAYKEQRCFMPGVVGRTAVLCGKSVVKIRDFLDALGSAVTRYVRV